ncbi:hypothetical protein KKH27_13915 [bacterium]|nr:hypothetical protein [bacterium]MBU1984235.1 hypothetical protein [bacterium]
MKQVVIVVLLLLALPLTLWAAERVEMKQAAKDVAVTVVSASETRTVLRFEIAGFSRETVEIEGQSYLKLGLPHESILLNAGEPELPRLCRSLMIPGDARMEIRVLSSEYRDFPNTRVVPSKGSLPRTVNPADVPYSFGPVYSQDAWYPAELATLREPYILRDVRGTVVDVNAFQYQPVQNLLRVYTSITVEVRATGRDNVNVLPRTGLPERMDPEFDRIYRRHFLNYDRARSALDYVPVMEQGELLIISYADFMDEMQPLVEWKIQKGIPTTIVNVSAIGNNSSNITSYIQNFYTSSGGALAFVILVGDATQVATPTASGGSSDPSYAKVAGGDDYPDIFIGRFSAESGAHVITQVERSIEYERNAEVGGMWYRAATGIASDEGAGIGHNGEADYVHMGYIRNDLLSYTYTTVDQIYDPGATAAQVTTAVNAGRGVINYVGHGSIQAWSTTGFSTTNVSALTNANRLPLIFSVACQNGHFSGYTCFGEAWLRATTGGEPSGALAAYMSSIDQDWVPPMHAQDEFSDLLIAEAKHTVGGLCYNSSCRMIDMSGTSGVNMYNTWHIFGDPSVPVRTNTPTAMSVAHVGEIFFGQPTFDVTVSGVTGALCAISQGTTLFGAAYTNAGGAASIPIAGDLPIGEIVKLTVTAFNKLTYVADLSVVTSGPDIWPPNVSFVPLSNTDDETGPYTLTATISDNSGVANAELHYGFNGTNFSGAAMTNVSGNIWSVNFGGFPAGTIVYYFVTATDASDSANTAVSDTFEFAVLGILFADDMESGQSEWTTAAVETGWANQWHVSSEMSHAGVRSWKFGDTGTGTYATHAYGGLVSPSVYLRGQASLSFWHWIQAEVSGYYPDSAYDAGVVDISVDGGAWQQLLTLSPSYNKVSRCTAGGSTPYTGPFSCRTPCFSGSIGWTQENVSLDAYAGHDVQVRFRFGSDNSGALEGWYVDDVVIFGLPEIVPPIPVSDLTMDVIETGELRLTWMPTGASEYKVYSSENPEGPFSVLETTTASSEVLLPATDELRFFIVVAAN